VFSATIEEMTNNTPRDATVSNQIRARVDKPASANSATSLGRAKVSTTRHPLGGYDRNSRLPVFDRD